MSEKLEDLYNDMVANGVQIDHHESDMYVPVNETTTRILNNHYPTWRFAIFISELDGKKWYNIPFAYAPFWERKGEK